MEEFRKLLNFVLLMITTVALKKGVGDDLARFVPTLSTRYASRSVYGLWDDFSNSVDPPAMLKLSFRSKAAPIASPVVLPFCSLAYHNYTLLTTQDYGEWLLDQTKTSRPRFDPVVHQAHQGPTVIFHKHHRVTALILSNLVFESFEALWNSSFYRCLLHFILRWGSTVAFWLTSIAGPENIYAFEQIRAALFRRGGKRRRPTPSISMPLMLPAIEPAPLVEVSKVFAIPQPYLLDVIERTSNFAMDLERELDYALQLDYSHLSFANVASEAVEDGQVALENMLVVEEGEAGEHATEEAGDLKLVVAEEDAMAEDANQAGEDEAKENVEVQVTDEPSKAVVFSPLQIMRARSKTFRFPPVSSSTSCIPRINAGFDKGKMKAETLPPRWQDTAPRIVVRQTDGKRAPVVMRFADANSEVAFKGVVQEMKALRLLADCEWAARLITFWQEENQFVEIQLRFYAPNRAFKYVMECNGGFLSPRVAVFYLAELMAAIQSFHSYGLIHTDIDLEDLTLSPRGDLIIHNFDKSEIFEEGRLPYWIPRHQNNSQKRRTGYHDYKRAAYLYHTMLTGVPLSSRTGPKARHLNQQTDRKQQLRDIDFEFIHFVIGNYPLMGREEKEIFEHELLKDIDWSSIKDQTAEVPINRNSFRERSFVD